MAHGLQQDRTSLILRTALGAVLGLSLTWGAGRVAAQAPNAAQKAPNAIGEGANGVVPGEPPGADGEIVALDANERAPWAGLLIEETDLVKWKLTIDHLRFRLDRDIRLEIEKSGIRVGVEKEKMALAQESYRLREGMYKERLAERDKAILAAEKRAEEASERGFFEQPLLWFVAGLAVPIISALAF